MQMICILLGVPEKERHWLFHAIEPTFDFGESRKGEVGANSFEKAESVEEAGSRMFAYGTELIAAKGANPVTTCCRWSPTPPSRIRSPVAVRHRVVHVLQPVVQRRRGRPRATGSRADCWPRQNPDQYRRLQERPGTAAHGHRGDDPLDLPVTVEATHRHPRHRTGRVRDPGRGQGAGVGGSANRDAGGVRPRRPFDVARKPNPHLGFGQGCTTAWARTSPGSNCGCSTRTADPVLRDQRRRNRWSGRAATGTPGSGTCSSNSPEASAGQLVGHGHPLGRNRCGRTVARRGPRAVIRRQIAAAAARQPRSPGGLAASACSSWMRAMRMTSPRSSPAGNSRWFWAKSCTSPSYPPPPTTTELPAWGCSAWHQGIPGSSRPSVRVDPRAPTRSRRRRRKPRHIATRRRPAVPVNPPPAAASARCGVDDGDVEIVVRADHLVAPSVGIVEGTGQIQGRGGPLLGRGQAVGCPQDGRHVVTSPCGRRRPAGSRR